MRNHEIIELFNLVPPFTPVDIVEFRVTDGGWAELANEARSVREAVFVREQGIAATEEWDCFDAVARHAVAFGPDGEPVGTARLLDDGRLGRMSVLASWRGKGVGSALLDRLLEFATRAGMIRLRLHARQSAATFYRQWGFVQRGDPFLEVGTPHVLMERILGASGA